MNAVRIVSYRIVSCLHDVICDHVICLGCSQSYEWEQIIHLLWSRIVGKPMTHNACNSPETYDTPKKHLTQSRGLWYYWPWILQMQDTPTKSLDSKRESSSTSSICVSSCTCTCLRRLGILLPCVVLPTIRVLWYRYGTYISSRIRPHVTSYYWYSVPATRNISNHQGWSPARAGGSTVPGPNNQTTDLTVWWRHMI